jgi:hypothetical protein
MADCNADIDEIATSTGLLAADLESHFSTCCQAPAIASSMEQSDARLAALQERINLSIISAGLQGDHKSQLQALSLQLRSELEVRRRLEQNPDPRDLPSNNADWSDDEKERFHGWLDSIIPQGIHLIDLTAEEVARELAPLDPDGATQKRLSADLKGLARILISHYSDVAACDETVRIFLSRVDEIKKKQAQVAQKRGVAQ